MSWVSQANIKTIMTAIRNKFTTGDLVIANDAKDTGVELNYASQDGLVTVSPISTSASTEAALHLSNGDDTKKTELTQGTLSYVTGTGSSETYNYMSLLGDGVTFGKNGGGNVQVGGVADPTSAQQVATKNYVDSFHNRYNIMNNQYTFNSSVTVPAYGAVLVYQAERDVSKYSNTLISATAYVKSANDSSYDKIYYAVVADARYSNFTINLYALNMTDSDITISSDTVIDINETYEKY